jgi:hypothetical protein
MIANQCIEEKPVYGEQRHGGACVFLEKQYASPYINRFLQPDTVIPDQTNPQTWNRFSYVENRPILFNDPFGHDSVCGYSYSDPECEGVPTTPSDPPGGGGSCNTPWPWYCNNNPPDSEDPEREFDETSGTSGTTPETWCGGERCFGDVYFHQLDTDPVDARIISWSFAIGFGTFYFSAGGIDVVWTGQGVVVFLEGAAYVDPVRPNVPWSGTTHDVYFPALFGESLTYGTITSVHIRENPLPQGIREAWSGLAVQEGGSYGMFTVNASSSADFTGNPNFLTTSQVGGFGVGIAEVHQYLTIAVPYYEFDR